MNAAPGRQLHPALLRPDPENCTSPAATIGAELDRAIQLFRNAMPGCGLKLVVPPPLPDGTSARVSLSAWRRGGQSTPVHAGKTAEEAMLRVFDSGDRADHERRRRAGCGICRGVGWYIATGGIRAICPHPLSPPTG